MVLWYLHDITVDPIWLSILHSLISALFTRRFPEPELPNYFSSKNWSSQIFSRSCTSLLLFALKRDCVVVVLSTLQPNLTGLEGSGCPNPLLGLSIPCWKGATSNFGISLLRVWEKASLTVLLLSTLHRKAISNAPCESKSVLIIWIFALSVWYTGKTGHRYGLDFCDAK